MIGDSSGSQWGKGGKGGKGANSQKAGPNSVKACPKRIGCLTCGKPFITQMRPLLSIRKMKRPQPDNARNLQKTPPPQPKGTEGGSCWVIGGGMNSSAIILSKMSQNPQQWTPKLGLMVCLKFHY